MSDALNDSGKVSRFVLELASHGRTDCFSAFNTRDGKGYRKIESPVTEEVIQDHISSRQPIALYLFKGNETRLAALDVDNHDGDMPWEDLTARIKPVLSELRELGMKPFPVRSGSGAGLHIWLVWKESQCCMKVRAFLAAVLAKHNLKHGTTGIADNTVEVFPKSNEVKGGSFGSPLALPFARKSLPLSQALETVDLERYDPPEIEEL